MRYFEDIEIGARAVLGHHTFAREEMLAFARTFDPQPFHVDEEAAKRSPYGAIIASGWLTVAVWMKCLLAHEAAYEAARKGTDKSGIDKAAAAGASPGFTELHWLRPVFAGDTLTYTTEVKEKVESRSKPQWGILRSYNAATNQHGELVMEFNGAVFLRRRGW